MTEAVVFTLFSGVMLMSALFVISARNPVHSVLWLIMAFINAAGLFVLLNAEFLAMILVVVYVGAVAVLFLFVVMMLDVDFSNLRAGMKKILPVALIAGGVLLAELVVVLLNWQPMNAAYQIAGLPTAENVENTRALGDVLYTRFFFLFLTAGMILLVAMIGAILLTHRKRSDVRHQDIEEQNARTAKDAIRIVKVKPGEGVKL